MAGMVCLLVSLESYPLSYRQTVPAKPIEAQAMKHPGVRLTRSRVFAGMTVVALNLVLAQWGLGGVFQCIVVFGLVTLSFACLLAGSCMTRSGPARALIALGILSGSSLISIPAGRLVSRYEV